MEKLGPLVAIKSRRVGIRLEVSRLRNGLSYRITKGGITLLRKLTLKANTAMKKNVSNCKVAAIRYVKKFRILTKMRRETKMPCTMVDRPGRVRMISAAARAASVAPCTATPTSARFKAGASFTPSPVIPVLYPSSRRHSTMRYLCSGYT